MDPNGPDTDERVWLALLRCPSCHSSLTFLPVSTPAAGRGIWGTLTCPCTTYPVIDGVPVLVQGRVATHLTGDPVVLDPGPTIEDLVHWVTGSDPMKALSRLLNLSPVPWPLTKLGVVKGLHRWRATRRPRSWLASRRLRQLLANRDDQTIEEWLAALYLYGPDGGDNHAYFTCRYAQPRQLAFLSILEAVPSGRMIDIGCGFGHMAWMATSAGRDVIGVDYNFAQLWVARWYVAPTARFVCADATRRLPFDNDAATSTNFCDGIHYIPEAVPLMAEMRRCAVDGTFFLTRFSNADILPPDAHDHSARQWQAWLDDLGPNRLLAEATLIDGYLDGRAVDLTRSDEPEVLARAKWLFAVASDNPDIFVDQGPLPSPAPHTRGTLQINPIYVPVGKDERHLRLAFPSDWFAFEDAELTRHHAYQAVITPAQMAQLGSNDPTGILAPLVDRFVVIGMPDRAYRSLQRRFKPRVHQLFVTLFPRRLTNLPDAATYPPTPSSTEPE